MAHDDFFDPEGERHGLPTYPRNLAPRGLMTRAQLLDLGLGLGGQHPVAQLMWRSRCGGSKNGVRNAWLYYAHLAAPKQPLTPAKERFLARAYIARCTCRECGEIHPYCLPTSIGRVCPPGTGCAADVRLAA